MIVASQLHPIRVPELGPSLGKLVSGVERPTQWIPLDTIRYELATQIIEHAGEARRLAAAEDRSSALAALGGAAWRDAWDEAVTSVADTFVEKVSVQLEAEAVAVKMGKRRRAKLRVDDATKRTLTARLGATGAALVPALDAIDRCTSSVLVASSTDPEPVEKWQDAQKLAARRLESAWLALEQAVEAEMPQWQARMDQVGRWRKPLWPVMTVALPALAIAVWLGLIFGGYVDAPGWFERIWSQVPR